jgi:DHA2 family multidrug resistance protein-like MFS transporter
MQQQETTAAPPRAGRREWIGLAVLALPALLVALDIGVLFLALPHLSAELEASGTEQLWITDTYGFLLAGLLVTMGSLGDRIGRRRLLLIGAAAFGGASALAAYSTTPEMLIVARGLLGVAGATLGPSTLALISNMFHDGRQRGLAISVWAACQFGGGALGPVVGGLMLSHFWWGSVFLLGIPVMVLLLMVGPLLLPEYRAPGAGRIDLVSVALSFLAILPIVYAIKEFAAGDNDSPVVATAAIAIGLLMGSLFLLRQRRLDHPLVDLRLFSTPSFAVMLAAMALGSSALAGVSLLTSQYVQSVVQMSPAAAGAWQAPTGLGIAAGVLLAPTLIAVFIPTTVITLGLGLSAVGLLALTQLGTSGGLAMVVVCIAVVALGLGPLFALGTGLVVSSVPPEKAGSAASLSETSNVLGSTLGLAVLGAIGAAIYRDRLGDSAPAGVPAEVVDAARETIGRAAAAAGQLPPRQGADLLDAARNAFTSGLNVAAAVGAAVMIGIAVAIKIALRPNATTANVAPDTARS